MKIPTLNISDLFILVLIISNILQNGIISDNQIILEISILFTSLFLLLNKKFNLFIKTKTQFDLFLSLNLFLLPFSTLIFTYQFGLNRFLNCLGLSIVFLILNSIALKDKNLDIYKIIFFISIFALGINILYVLGNGYTTYRYSGIFSNPNESGRFTYFIFSTVLLGLISRKKNILKENRIYSLFSLGLLLIFTISSNSRITVLLLISQLFFILCIKFFTKGNYKYFRSFINKLLEFKLNKYILIFSISIIIFYYFGLADNMIDKLLGNSYSIVANADYTNGRIELWKLGINFLSDNFGGFSNEFINEYNLNAIHNNYIHFAIKYSIFSSIILFTIFFSIFIYSLKYIKHSDNAFFLSNMILQVLVYWFFETTTIIFPILLIFYSFGCLKKELKL